MRQFPRPCNLLAAMGLVTFIASFFLNAATVDFHMHDTYYVMDNPHLFWIVSFLLLFYAVLYGAMNDWLLSRHFTWMHILTTLPFLVTLLLSTPPFIDFSIWYPASRHPMQPMMGYLLLLFLFGNWCFL